MYRPGNNKIREVVRGFHKRHGSCYLEREMTTQNEMTHIRSFAIGLLGAAALAAGLMLVRQQKEPETDRPSSVPAGETQPATISLDRIRALGY